MAISDLEIILSAFSNFLAFEPSQEEDFFQATQVLLGFGKPYIPDEYAEFLSRVSNGLSLDGMWFFGTLEQYDRTYSIPSLITVAEQFSNFLWIEKYLMVGQFFGLLIAYNYESNKYETINMLTFQTVDKYETFEDMFYAIIAKRTEE